MVVCVMIVQYKDTERKQKSYESIADYTSIVYRIKIKALKISYYKSLSAMTIKGFVRTSRRNLLTQMQNILVDKTILW